MLLSLSQHSDQHEVMMLASSVLSASVAVAQITTLVTDPNIVTGVAVLPRYVAFVVCLRNECVVDGINLLV